MTSLLDRIEDAIARKRGAELAMIRCVAVGDVVVFEISELSTGRPPRVDHTVSLFPKKGATSVFLLDHGRMEWSELTWNPGDGLRPGRGKTPGATTWSAILSCVRATAEVLP